MPEPQALWTIYPQIDRMVFAPGEQLRLGIVVQNVSGQALYFSKAEVIPSWADKPGIKPTLKTDYLATGQSCIVADFELTAPVLPGEYTIRFGLETWLYNWSSLQWQNLGSIRTMPWGPVLIAERPVYRAFVTMSSRKEDQPVVKPIRRLLELWGFAPETVGIDVFEEDPQRIAQKIRQRLEQADAQVAIATARDYNLIEGTYRTFPWFHVETGLGFQSDKPLLFIIDERVKLEGLLEYPTFPRIFYNPLSLEALEYRLALVMPAFRAWVAQKKQQQFFDALLKAGLVTAAGIAGLSLLGSLDKRS